MTDFELDKIWINAFAALGRIKLTSDKPGKFDGGAVADVEPLVLDDGAVADVEPLVRLLRSNTPMTPGARDTLAELLSPGDPPYMNWKLVPEQIKRVDPIAKQLDGATAFEQNRNAGMSVQDAADQASIRGGRQILRYRALLGRLGRRLHGEDPPPKSR
jgi:hypothetical protein